jgi:hypothetical protein
MYWAVKKRNRTYGHIYRARTPCRLRPHVHLTVLCSVWWPLKRIDGMAIRHTGCEFVHHTVRYRKNTTRASRKGLGFWERSGRVADKCGQGGKTEKGWEICREDKVLDLV